jgi:hypothetical protein
MYWKAPYTRKYVLAGVKFVRHRGQEDSRNNQNDDPEQRCPDVEPTNVSRRQADDDVREKHHCDVNEVDVPNFSKIVRVC